MDATKDTSTKAFSSFEVLTTINEAGSHTTNHNFYEKKDFIELESFSTHNHRRIWWNYKKWHFGEVTIVWEKL